MGRNFLVSVAAPRPTAMTKAAIFPTTLHPVGFPSGRGSTEASRSYLLNEQGERMGTASRADWGRHGDTRLRFPFQERMCYPCVRSTWAFKSRSDSWISPRLTSSKTAAQRPAHCHQASPLTSSNSSRGLHRPGRDFVKHTPWSDDPPFPGLAFPSLFHRLFFTVNICTPISN